MKIRYGLLAASIAALFAVGAVSATSAPAAKVTGGGQTLNGTTGAGDTIAFVAQDTDADAGNVARGQVQYVDRTDTGQTVKHGLVTCLTVTANSARLGGDWADGSGTFEVLVEDNGEGANAPDDMIGVYPTAESNCEDDDDNSGEDDDTTVALARGNAQVH
jgi:curli biogenesis system outer membrane secretion channel CsgG